MNFQLMITESLPLGIKRIATEQVDHTLQALESYQENKEETVHELRRSFKKLRAVLRLIRSEIGDAHYRLENNSYRDIGRSISALRDASAMIETLELLKADFDKAGLHESYMQLRKYLLANRRRMLGSVLQSEDEKTKIKLLLQESKRRIAMWSLQQESFKAIEAGLMRVYQQGCEAMQLAYHKPSVEHFHDWRKRAKYLRYQIDVLQPLWPAMLIPLEQEIHQLSDLLGLDHDLAVLEQTLHIAEAGLQATEILHVYENIIEPQRFICQAQAQRLGARIYQETPQAFTRRMKGYFKVWGK